MIIGLLLVITGFVAGIYVSVSAISDRFQRFVNADTQSSEIRREIAITNDRLSALLEVANELPDKIAETNLFALGYNPMAPVDLDGIFRSPEHQLRVLQEHIADVSSSAYGINEKLHEMSVDLTLLKDLEMRKAFPEEDL